MNIIVEPGHPLIGKVTLPGDKSLSHRAALFAALAEGQSCIENFLVSGVTSAMLESLRALSVDWTLDGTTLTVNGQGWQRLTSPDQPLNCGNSATTLRLLAGALAAAGIPAILDGSPGLRSRPMGRILEPLRQMGVTITGAPGERAPLVLDARPPDQLLTGLDYTLPVASAQVKSCLLLAALAADGPVHLVEPGLSRDHSERMLAHMGVQVTSSSLPDQARYQARSQVTLVPPTQPLRPLHMHLPGDFSAAAFLIVAALITPGSEIELENVGLNPTRTGLLEVLSEMGADLQVDLTAEQGGEPCGKITARYSQLKAGNVAGQRVVRMIDEFPIFAIAACQAQGRSQVSQAAELRLKESDRISTLATELRNLGVEVQEAEDGFSIQGGTPLSGATVSPHGDHRLAMALAVAGLAGKQLLQVQDAEIIHESFPDFISVLRQLGAQVDQHEDGHAA